MRVLNVIINTIAVVFSLLIIPINPALGLFLGVGNGLLLLMNINKLEKSLGEEK